MSNGFTVKETAEYFGVSDTAVFTWIRDGKLEATNVAGSDRGRGNRYLVSEEAIEKWETTRKPRKKYEKKAKQPTGSKEFFDSLTDDQKGYLSDFMSGLFYLMETITPVQESYVKKIILEIVDPTYRERIREVLNEKV